MSERKRRYSYFGASNVRRRKDCPASWNEELKLGERLDSSDDNRGRVQHLADETGDLSKLSDYERGRLEIYQGMRDRKVEEVSQGRTITGRVWEPELKLLGRDGKELGWCHPDCVVGIDGGVAVNAELKTHPAANEDPEDVEWQLRYQNAAILQAKPAWKAVVGWCGNPYGPTEHERITTREDLPSEVSILESIYSASKAADPAYTTVPQPCLWCSARGNCSHACETSFAIRKSHLAEVQRLTPDGIEITNHRQHAEFGAKVRAAMKILTEVKRELDSAVLSTHARGEDLPHHQVQKGRAIRKIRDKEIARASLPVAVLSEVEQKASRKWSVTELEAAVRVVLPNLGPKQVKDAVDEWLSDQLELKLSTPVVVPKPKKEISDERKQ